MAKGKTTTPATQGKALEPIKQAPVTKPAEEKKKVEESDEYSLEFEESKAA